MDSWLHVNGFDLDTPLGYLLLCFAAAVFAVVAWLLLGHMPASLRQRFREAGNKLVRLAQSMDEKLAYCGNIFGARHRAVAGQFGHFAAVYGAGYMLAVVPISVLLRRGIDVPFYVWIIALTSLAILYFGVIAVWRSWDQNESKRAKIIRYRDHNGQPDELPDLRNLAVLSAMQLVALAPLIFWCLDGAFGLFPIAGDEHFHNWVRFVLWVSWHAEPASSSTYAAAVVALVRLTVAYILVQGMIRTVLICRDVREAVACAVKNDSFDNLLLIGRRSVPLLLARIEEDEENKVKVTSLSKAYDALGNLGDERAIESLAKGIERHSGAIANAAIDAIRRIGGPQAVDALVAVFKGNRRAEVVQCVAAALSRLGDPKAVAALEEDNDRRPAVQKAISRALSRLRRLAGRSAGAMRNRSEVPRPPFPWKALVFVLTFVVIAASLALLSWQWPLWARQP